MLCLGRRRDESVVLVIPPSDQPREVRVLVCDIVRENQARLGFDAPADIKIYRTEIKEKIDAAVDQQGR